jgi:hypothetical protein
MSEAAKPPSRMVPEEGIEPTLSQGERDFEFERPSRGSSRFSDFSKEFAN